MLALPNRLGLLLFRFCLRITFLRRSFGDVEVLHGEVGATEFVDELDSLGLGIIGVEQGSVVLEVVVVLGDAVKSGGVAELPVALSEVGLDQDKLWVPLLLHNFLVNALLKVLILALVP